MVFPLEFFLKVKSKEINSQSKRLIENFINKINQYLFCKKNLFFLKKKYFINSISNKIFFFAYLDQGKKASLKLSLQEPNKKKLEKKLDSLLKKIIEFKFLDDVYGNSLKEIKKNYLLTINKLEFTS